MGVGKRDTISKIPVVEFSRENLNPGTDSWLQTCETITQSLEDHGCFIVETNDVSLQLHDSVLRVTEELFGLPRKTNQNDRKFIEAFNIDHAENVEDCQNFTSRMWPVNGNEQFCQTVHSYMKFIGKLEKTIGRMVFESYGVQKDFDFHAASTTYVLRLIKYKKQPEEVKVDQEVAGHTDATFLTVLHQNNVTGLQVRTKDGEWYTFEPSPSSFMVMAGDACAAWSKGKIKSCLHRVVMDDSSEVRYSLGVFSYQGGLFGVRTELKHKQHHLQQFKKLDDVSIVHHDKDELIASNRKDESLPDFDNNSTLFSKINEPSLPDFDNNSTLFSKINEPSLPHFDNNPTLFSKINGSSLPHFDNNAKLFSKIDESSLPHFDNNAKLFSNVDESSLSHYDNNAKLFLNVPPYDNNAKLFANIDDSSLSHYDNNAKLFFNMPHYDNNAKLFLNIDESSLPHYDNNAKLFLNIDESCLPSSSKPTNS